MQMGAEQKTQHLRTVDDLAQRLYPSNPNGIYRSLNQDLIGRARQINVLTAQAIEFRRLGQSAKAEEKEAKIAKLASG